ncbi:MAG: DNA mismatch repair endonuclease MutL [Flavobacteriales bacterium]|nr:DNA mismatch repair endonuclease MutL [Flavobacteriales bacterium]
MGDVIRLLPDHVANQIAAGEVVQRPASVVKELLENSVDAGATHITLVVRDAGRTLVQVTDNGRGMGPNDARLCFERHATSKIDKADDLQHIRTKGFRGEALASIAAVAQVELRARHADDETGLRIRIDGSRIQGQEPIAAPIGTTIAVRNLFYNVPARRQFLKSDPVEMKHVLEELHRVALAHPDIAFDLVQNDQESLRTPPQNERQRIVQLLGRKYDERLVPVEESTELVAVKGFIGKPEFARRSRGEQYFFVNRRYIRSHYLDHAVRRAYDELIGKESYPSWFLFLELDPAQIDINIHPTKTEIKFRDDRVIYAIVHAAVRRALGRFNIVPSLDFEPEPALLVNTEQQAMPRPATTWRPQDLGPRRSASGWQQLFDDRPSDRAERSEKVPHILPSRELDDEPGPRPVFQLHGKYVLAQVRTGFVVIDRRRALERIVYERALRALQLGNGPSQTQLFPRNVELSATDHALITELLPDLRTMGFVLDTLSGRTLTISGLPAEAAEEDPQRLLEQLLEQLHQERSALKLERHEAMARSMARSMAVRRTEDLDTARIHDLIDRLFACEMPYFTPGGKPTLITFGLDELGERFERG